MKKEKIEPKKKRTCNRCKNQMGVADAYGHYFCVRADCGNFALLQIPVEFLEK